MIAEVEVLMDGSFFGTFIAIGTGTLNNNDDEKIFFYVDNEEELNALMKEDNGEDFRVTKIYNWRTSLNSEDIL